MLQDNNDFFFLFEQIQYEIKASFKTVQWDDLAKNTSHFRSIFSTDESLL